MTLQQIVILIIGVVAGIAILTYHREVVRIIGVNDWAERTFGAGGTYTLWQLIGAGICVLSILYGTGTLDGVITSIVGLFLPR